MAAKAIHGPRQGEANEGGLHRRIGHRQSSQGQRRSVYRALQGREHRDARAGLYGLLVLLRLKSLVASVFVGH